MLFVLLERVRWTPRLAAGTLGVLVVLALALVGVGFWEYATKHLLLNPKVIDSNQFESYFRVNSLFFDPNIYGRFLIVVMIGVAAVVAWTSRSRTALAGAVVARGAVGGARADVLAVVASPRCWSASRSSARCAGASGAALAATAVVAVVGVAVVLLAPSALRLDLATRKSVDDADERPLRPRSRAACACSPSGRSRGWGSGAFPREYRRAENASDERATSASHTIPITVAAEQGLIGLAAYVALLAARAVAAARGDRAGRARSRRRAWRSPPRSRRCSCTRCSTRRSSRTR